MLYILVSTLKDYSQRAVTACHEKNEIQSARKIAIQSHDCKIEHGGDTKERFRTIKENMVAERMIRPPSSYACEPTCGDLLPSENWRQFIKVKALDDSSNVKIDHRCQHK